MHLYLASLELEENEPLPFLRVSAKIVANGTEAGRPYSAWCALTNALNASSASKKKAEAQLTGRTTTQNT